MDIILARTLAVPFIIVVVSLSSMLLVMRKQLEFEGRPNALAGSAIGCKHEESSHCMHGEFGSISTRSIAGKKSLR